jgi:hypothetical protein
MSILWCLKDTTRTERGECWDQPFQNRGRADLDEYLRRKEDEEGDAIQVGYLTENHNSKSRSREFVVEVWSRIRNQPKRERRELGTCHV